MSLDYTLAAMVTVGLLTYLTYAPANVERQYADALNMMTLNFRTLDE